MTHCGKMSSDEAKQQSSSQESRHSSDNEERHDSDNEKDSKDTKDAKPYSLHIGNLNYDTKEQTLRDTFGKYGKVTGCTIVRNVNGSPIGRAYIDMENESDAKNAIEALNDNELDGRKIKVEFKKPREELRRERGRSSRYDDDRRGRRGRYDRYSRYDDRDRYDRYERRRDDRHRSSKRYRSPSPPRRSRRSRSPRSYNDDYSY